MSIDACEVRCVCRGALLKVSAADPAGVAAVP